MTAANAVLVALVARGRGTGGQHVEVNMLDAVVSWLWMDCMWNEVSADTPDIPNYTDWYSPLEMREVISAEIAKWTRDELIARFRANDVPCGPVLDRPEVRLDPQVQHNGAAPHDKWQNVVRT